MVYHPSNPFAQIPQTAREQRCAIQRNIGQASARLGQFLDAAQAFEGVLAHTPDHTTALQLIVCSYALGDVDKMRRVFSTMLTLPLLRGLEEDDEEEDAEGGGAGEEGSGAGPGLRWMGEADPLRAELRQRKKHAERWGFDLGWRRTVGMRSLGSSKHASRRFAVLGWLCG